MELVINILAMVLSVAATIVTVVGFFAALRFYREGSALQRQAQELLARIDERISTVQAQVGGMFNKTLDAAIARATPAVAAKEQERLLHESSPEKAETPTRSVPGAAPIAPDLAADVIKYFNVQNARYTDVSSDALKWIFSLGARQGFSLFDGPKEFVFFRYFKEDIREAALRTRLLLETLDIEWQRNVASVDPPNAWMESTLRMISVTLLVPDGSDLDALRTVVDKYQPSWHRIPVTVLNRSDLKAHIETAYESLGIPVAAGS